MSVRIRRAVLLVIGAWPVLAVLACRGGSAFPGRSDGAVVADGSPNTHPDGSRTDGKACGDGSADTPSLEVRFLGVAGFSFRHRGEMIMSAPLYTNPDLFTVLMGEIASDHAVVDRFLDSAFVQDCRAIIVGHAHYDHLLDVPYVWTRTNRAHIYGSLTVQNLLAGFASDPAPGCDSLPDPVPWALVDRDRVIALNDPENLLVDTRMCVDQETCTGVHNDNPGQWVAVPSSNIRFRALCSSHPDQFFIFHFGEGCIDAGLCSPPAGADGWVEGATFAYLVDFLDPGTGRPVFRVYFQDAPADPPVSYVHPDVLAEKGVDVAVLCVGNYDQVPDHPIGIIESLGPRYVLAGHWENFFKPQDEPVEPIPFHPSPDVFINRLESALPPNQDAPVLVNGIEETARWWMPNPGTDFVFQAEP